MRGDFSLCRGELFLGVETGCGNVISGVESFMLQIQVLGIVRVSDDLERDHLVQMLSRNLRQHLGDRRLEHAVVTVGVVGRDITDRLETNRFIGRLGFPGVGHPEQILRFDVAQTLPLEFHDRLDSLGEFAYLFLRNFRNPDFP